MDQTNTAKPAETLGLPNIDSFYPERAIIQQSQPKQHDDCTGTLKAVMSLHRGEPRQVLQQTSRSF